MVEISKLDAAVVAKHLAAPEGDIGIAVADGMNKRNWPIYEEIFRRLEIRQPAKLLEIGFGNGKLLSRILSMANLNHYSGVDISKTMVIEANKFNHDLIKNGKADFICAPAEALPFADGYFNYAIAINVIYFWPEPVRALSEIRRVLRHGGALVLSAGHPSTMITGPYAQHGFHLHDAAQMLELCKQAGFSSAEDAEYLDSVATLAGDGVTSRANILITCRC